MSPETKAQDVTSANSGEDNGWEPVYGFRHKTGNGSLCGRVFTDGTKWRCECGFETDDFIGNFFPIYADVCDI